MMRKSSSFRCIALIAAIALNESVLAKSAKAAIATDLSASVQSDPKWISRCSQLAPCCSILCSFAHLPTIVQVSRKRSTGSLPLLPYSSMIANGFIWTLYGWLQDLPSVLYANLIGTVLGLYYFREFRVNCPAGTSNLPGTARQHKLVVTWIIFANLFLVANTPKDQAAEIIGKEAVFIYVILFASPLAALQEVITTKSAASIPLPFSVASLINCSLWSIVGLLKFNDFNIYFPCMLGLGCSVVQLLLKGIYDDAQFDKRPEISQQMSKV